MKKNKEDLTEDNGLDGVSDRESTVDINTDDNVAGTHHLNQNLDEDDLLEKLKADLQEQKDKYLRLLAEFENYKRRSQADPAHSPAR